MKIRTYKSSSRKQNRRKYMLPITLLTIIIAMFSCATLAWVVSNTDVINNMFQLQSSGIELEETFENNVKSDVYVKNTSDATMYVRIALVEQIADADGSIKASTGELYFDYIGLHGEDWQLFDDYYYYTKPLVKDAKTTMLFTKATQKGSVVLADGEELSLTVMTEGIQVNGVQDAWGVTLDDNGTITAVATTTGGGE